MSEVTLAVAALAGLGSFVAVVTLAFIVGSPMFGGFDTLR